jgi:DNA-directed RNA polymerase specialized sigma24 family protein
LDESSAASDFRLDEVIAVDQALAALESRDPVQARLVELMFFGGLAIDDAARVMGISLGDARREWTFAKAWLRRELDRRGK